MSSDGNASNWEVSPHFSVFQHFGCPEHGWSVDANLIARKDGLAITAHGLHGLVQREGWRGAERIIATYGRDFERYDQEDSVNLGPYTSDELGKLRDESSDQEGPDA